MQDMIMGVQTIQEVLQHAPHRILQVFTAKDPQKDRDPLLQRLLQKGIAVSYTRKEKLSRLVESESHQSFVAQVQKRKIYRLEELFLDLQDKPHALVVMLDHITDPQNFGALMRSAECFGAEAVVWSKNRGCDVTPTVSKASCGASELIRLVRVSNLAQTVEAFQKEGFEAVSTGMDASAQSAWTFTFAPKTVAILGSEGLGVQPLIQKKSDHTLKIPLQGKIASLNVAQAGAVLFSLYASRMA